MKNRYINKNKFFNTKKGHNRDYFFLFPTVLFSSPKMIRWELNTKSITFAFLRFYYQINIFNVTKDSSKEIFKPDVKKILEILAKNNLNVDTIANLIKFLQENDFILSIIKNTDIDNNYAQRVLLYYFKDEDFVIKND